MAYDGDGNRIFQLNYNLHTDDDWKGNSGNGNGNNKDNSGSGNSSTGTTGTSESDTAINTSTGTANDNNGNATGNTNNTGGSQNQSGILFPIDGEVSELESELIGMIKTTGKEKNYELIEYVNDVNREHTEVLQELNINGIMDTSYTYGNERLTNERFTGEAAYYTYDPRGSVSGLTDSEGILHQSYRYDPFGGIDFGRPQYNNVYAYNAESYNGNMEHQYLRARYYDTDTADFLTEDSYLGKTTDPLTQNRYNYVKGSPLNYMDPSGHDPRDAYDRLEYHLPTASEIERMSGFYQDWQLRYNQTITSDQRWELIDLKGSYLNLSEGTFVEDLWNFICENPAYATGAIVGGAAAGIVLVMSGSIMVYPFASAATIIVAGATGGFVVGETATAIDNFSIEQELKKLGYDINEMTVYNLDKMPEEVWQLCEDYYDNTQKQQLYMDLSVRAMQLASILYLTEGVYQAGITMAQYLANRSAEGKGKYLNAPATKSGTLNIGAGSKPIEGAYNINVKPNT